MRVISFCADGLREAVGKGFFEWALRQDPDIICVQDLRTSESKLGATKYNPEGYFSYFFDSIEGTSNGVAIYCRKLPKAIMTGLGLGEADGEGRYIQADFENISIACLLAPAAGLTDPGSLARKSRFFEQLGSQLDKVRKKRRQYILCGNWNMVHLARDLRHTSTDQDDTGLLGAEREWLGTLFVELGYVDTFREVNTDHDEFSWWPAGRDGADASRVDYQVVSGGLRGTIEYATLFRGQEFSSHAPLTADYDIEIARL